jgi:hypothetical protein
MTVEEIDKQMGNMNHRTIEMLMLSTHELIDGWGQLQCFYNKFSNCYCVEVVSFRGDRKFRFSENSLIRALIESEKALEEITKSKKTNFK